MYIHVLVLVRCMRKWLFRCFVSAFVGAGMANISAWSCRGNMVLMDVCIDYQPIVSVGWYILLILMPLCMVANTPLPCLACTFFFLFSFPLPPPPSVYCVCIHDMYSNMHLIFPYSVFLYAQLVCVTCWAFCIVYMVVFEFCPSNCEEFQ